MKKGLRSRQTLFHYTRIRTYTTHIRVRVGTLLDEQMRGEGLTKKKKKKKTNVNTEQLSTNVCRVV